MRETELVRRIRLALEADNRSLEDVARLTGLSYHWLSKFKHGKIPDPGVQRLLKLGLVYSLEVRMAGEVVAS